MSSQQKKVDTQASNIEQAESIQKQQINQDQKQNDKQESEDQVDQSDICSAPKQTQHNEQIQEKQEVQNSKVQSSTLSAQLKEIEKNQIIQQQETHVQSVREPPTPQELFKHEQELKQKQKLINQILKMYDDFERLELRSEQLQSENKYFVQKIQEYEKIVYEDSDVSNI